MNDQPTASETWLETAVTLSQIQKGPGARAARLLKELTHPQRVPVVTDDELPGRLTERLWIAAPDRPATLSEARRQAREHLANRARHGLRPVTFRDEDYPELLRYIVDPPIVLWTRGALPTPPRPAVAVVGSRAATPTGLAIAKRLGADLTRAGLLVVSGMARGVDAAAHLGALEAGGETIAVLGSGADVAYPPEHADLARRIAMKGTVISELAPGTPPLPGHFPLRNRIISGMARAVVVVEASEHSGSLITARMALEQGREVLAVPGNSLSGRSRGCHALIRDGACIVENAADVLEQLRWTPLRHDAESVSTNSLQLNELEETMAIGEPYSVEDLAARTSRSASTLLADLGTLELWGRIVRTAGGRYLRLD